MKRILLLAVLGIVAVASTALAAAYTGTLAGPDLIPRYMKAGFFVGTGSTGSTTNRVTKMLGNSATIDFASTKTGCIESSAITVTGAVAGDACDVGTTTAAGALKASFTCYVSAADAVKVKFCPQDLTTGNCTLGGESPAVCPAQTVSASSTCTCSNVGTTAAIAALGCSVSLSGTTLTLTSANAATHVVNYQCAAPVDPASGTFYVRVTSAQ